MGLRFHKSLQILPGIRLNISKSGPSISVGGAGASFNIGPKGERGTVGLPGSGLSYSETASGRGKSGNRIYLIGVFLLAIGSVLYKLYMK